jgi:hypothetical protein
MKQNRIKLTILSVTFITLFGCNSNNSSNSKVEKEEQNKEVTTNNSNTSETFIQIERDKIDELNKSIISNKISKEEDVVSLYKPKLEESEGNYTYSVSLKKLDDQTTEYTVIETGLLDDSVEGQKTVMTINNKDNLKVVSIKENYRCYRGHKVWSAEKCM